jgi:hypothetical protein
MMQLVYTSRRVEAFGDDEIDAMLSRARCHNARLGLTGVLLCTDTQFMQVLEGPRDEVERLRERIADDPRHEDMRIVMTRDVTRRDFGGWHMALSDVRLTTIPADSALARFFEPDFDVGALPEASAASFLLRAFRDMVITPDE